jgi:cytochrome oxidase Cu insertion factor (SCO1/SenC/PrrC family)
MDDSAKRMWMTGAQLLFVACAAVAVYGFVTVAREGEKRRSCSAECLMRPDYAGAERRAPSFTLNDMSGKPVSLDSFRGKVVVLNFWTKTCGPCLEEMPSLADLARILQPRTDVALVTISTDEGPDDVRDTLKSVLGGDPPFTVLFDPDAKNVIEGKFGTHLFPETWILDKSGIVRARFDGGREWSNPAVVELVDQLRSGDYCPLKVDKKVDRDGQQAAKFCESLSGS